jgi:serine protease Do
MKNASLCRCLLVSASFAGAVAALHAADDGKPRPTGLAPLKLQIDTQPADRGPMGSYADVFEKAAPSVVNVSTTRKASTRGEEFFNDPMFRRFFGVPDQGSGRPQKEQSLGSGVILTSDGYILTNNHVVEGAEKILVAVGESPNEHEYQARVVGRDSKTDVAVLKIDATGLPAATLGDSDQLRVGDTVLAIGDPFAVGKTLTHGIVSATGRDIQLSEGDVEDFIQTDAPINPGNSGGALLDSRGRVVGINSAILSGSGTSSGVGFAVSINLARSVVGQLVASGRVLRGYLGVRMQDLSPDLDSQYGVASGALVDEVDSGSPADRAGLKNDDVIVKIDGKTIDDARRVQFIINRLAPGAQVAIDYVRDGKQATIQATLSDQPKTQNLARQGDSDQDSDTGVLNHVTVGDITPQVRTDLDLPSEVRGAVILEVDPNSASAAAGLQQGDVIVALDRQPVRNADEAVKLSTDIKGPKVVVRLWREGQYQVVVVDESS